MISLFRSSYRESTVFLLTFDPGRVPGSNNFVFGFDMMYCVARHFCLGFVFVACVAAGPRTRLSHLYSLSAN